MTFGEFIVKTASTALGAYIGMMIVLAVAEWELRRGRKFAVEAVKRVTEESAEYLREISPKWISTDVEMPEVDQSVIVHVVHRASPDDGWWVIESDIWCGDGWDVNADDDMYWVTHWRHVGERPEGFRNAETKVRRGTRTI